MRRILLSVLFMSFAIAALSQADTSVVLREFEVDTSLQTKPIVSFHRLDRKSLDKLNAINVADGARTLPGVIVQDYGGLGGLKTISVRSLGAEHTGVFIDGIKLTDTQTGQIDLGRLFIDNAEEISLYNGQPDNANQPASAYASASALMISTQLNRNLLDSGQFAAKVGFESGSFGMRSPSFSLGKNMGGNTYAKFYAKHLTTEGNFAYREINGSLSELRKRNNADLSALRTGLDFGHYFSSGAFFKAKGYYYNSERGLPGASTFYNPYSAQRLWNEDFFFQSQLTLPLPKRNTLSLYAKFANNYLQYEDPHYLNETGGLKDQYTQKEYYSSASWQWNGLRRLTLSLATDFIYNTLESTSHNTLSPQRLSWLSVVALKGHYKKWALEGNLLSTQVWENTENNEDISLAQKLTPFLGFAFQPNKTSPWIFRAHYKSIFRLPTFNDLYYNRVGNPNLKPELSRQLNFGVAFAKNNWLSFKYFEVGANAFGAVVDDKIVAIPTQNLFIWSIQNVGMVETMGAELFSRIELVVHKDHTISGYFNYTRQNALDKTDPESATYNHQIAYTPFESMKGGLSIAKNQLSVNWNVVYSGFRYALGENIYGNLLPAWSLHNFGMQWQFVCGAFPVRLNAVVNNLFDHQYAVIQNFPMPGRNYRLGILINYN